MRCGTRLRMTVRSKNAVDPSAYLSPSAQQPPAIPGQQQLLADQQTFGQVTQVLSQNLSTFGDEIDMNALYAASTGEHGPELQQAAQWLMAHPQWLTQLD